MLIVHNYARYSSVMQDDGFSIEYQMSECKDYCEKHGLILARSHIDQAKTATKVAGREAFWELLHCVTNNEVDVVIVYKMNRMFRDAEESHVYRKKFRKHGVKIISLTEPIDEETSAGRFMSNTLANLDQYQSESISDFVRSAHREMTKQGYYIGGTLPLGYETYDEEHGKKLRKGYKIVESEAVHVKKAFELYADGYTLRYILEYLKNEGVVGRRGKALGYTTLRRMLNNDLYIGNLRFATKGYPELVAEGVIPAIIDNDMWERVQQRKLKDKPVKPRKRYEFYPLTGKIECGYCGQHFFGISNTAKQYDAKPLIYKYYICSTKRTVHKCTANSIRKYELEQLVLSEIKKNILNEKSIKAIAQQVSDLTGETPKEIEKQINATKRQIANLDKRLDTLIEMKEKKEMSGSTLKRKSAAVEAEMEQLNIHLVKLQNKNTDIVRVEEVEKYLNEMMANIKSNDMDVIKAIFDNFVDKIIVTNDLIEIRLFVCPFFKFMYKTPSDQSNDSLYINVNRKKLFKSHSKYAE